MFEQLINIYNNAKQEVYADPNSSYAEDWKKKETLYRVIDKTFKLGCGIILSRMPHSYGVFIQYPSKCLCGHKQTGLIYNISYEAEDILKHISENIDTLKQIIEQNDAWHRGEN